MNNKATIINFSRMDDASARRVVDFITGTVYALSGEIQRVGDKIFFGNATKSLKLMAKFLSSLARKTASVNGHFFTRLMAGHQLGHLYLQSGHRDLLYYDLCRL